MLIEALINVNCIFYEETSWLFIDFPFSVDHPNNAMEEFFHIIYYPKHSHSSFPPFRLPF